MGEQTMRTIEFLELGIRERNAYVCAEDCRLRADYLQREPEGLWPLCTAHYLETAKRCERLGVLVKVIPPSKGVAAFF
jgi:hypothetical protein